MNAPFDGESAGITAVLGPTNTGKTHYAIERMLTYRTGVIGLPLRLLAREVYDKIVAKRGPSVVALITGEEKILPARAQYFVCTAEAMPLDGMADFVAVDEIQLCADPDRGHVFTDRLLNARGRRETMFMGSSVIRARIASLVPKTRFTSKERFSTLTYAGARKLSRLKPRTAVVAFSLDQVYAIAELIRRQRGGAAVVMGALSPRTRNAQVRLYQEGEVDYLVATDAIGMGLNLDVDHIAFAGTQKFDGHRFRYLMANEIGQIAGRAGRYTQDGTFGVTGEASPFDEDLVEAIENHRFKPLDRLQWRNSALDFATVDRLIQSLERAPSAEEGAENLTRAREAEDLAVLRHLCADQAILRSANHPARVRLLWDCCQIPDFRKVMATDHAGLIGRIYHFLSGNPGVIPSDWLAGQVERLDRVDGDIDALSKRIAFIRTWTYVANRAAWLEDPAAWRETTRAVEDRLSDALHERLTQRFVDRRTSVLMRRLKQKERLLAEVNENGEVTVEGEFAGRLDGFRFTADERAVGAEKKVLQSASLAALQAEFGRRADKLYNAPDGEIALTEQGALMWGTDAIGRLEKGDSTLQPRIRVFVDDIADEAVSEKVERRISHWLDRRVKALFEPMLAMQADETVTGLARGVAFQLSEAMGVIPRRQIADDVKALGQDERAMLRKHGVRFGQHHIFLPALLKPAPTRLRLVLWALSEGIEDIPSPPPPGQVTVAVEPGRSAGYWPKAGYRNCGTRALRIDMLERLADMLRPLDARAGFEATPDMLSITGCTLEQFAELMDGLGFQGEKGERPKRARIPEPKAETSIEPGTAEVPANQPTAPTADAPADQPSSAPVETATSDTETAAGETATGETATGETADRATGAEAEPVAVHTGAHAAADAGRAPAAGAADLHNALASPMVLHGEAQPATAELATPGTNEVAAETAVAETPTPEIVKTEPASADAPVTDEVTATAEPATEATVCDAAAPVGQHADIGAPAASEAQARAAGDGAERGAAADTAALASDDSATSETDALPADGAAPSEESEVFFVFKLKPRGRPGGRAPNRPGQDDKRQGGPRRSGGGGKGRRHEGHAGGKPSHHASGPHQSGAHQTGVHQAGAHHTGQPAAASAGTAGVAAATGDGHVAGGHGDGQKRHGPGPKKKGKGGKNQGAPRHDKGPSKRFEKPMDPDSPFAILAKLKNP
ncbi:MAG: helicase-related protein [Pseudomonadota bacterium]